MRKPVAGVTVMVLALVVLWLAGCRGGAEAGSVGRLPGVVWPLWPPGFAGSADSPGGPLFVALGGGDTGAYDFPYELVYDQEATSLTRRPLYLPCDRRVEFGKDSWPQVLAKVGFDENGVSFEFRPREGAVLAGGHWLPLVASSYDRQARELVLVFRRVEMSAGTAGVLRPDCAGCPVDRVTIRCGEGNLEARIALRWPALWRAEVLSLGGKGYSSTVRCRVVVRQAR